MKKSKFTKSSTYREDVSESTIFSNLIQVREETSKRMNDYNEKHPHSSL